MDKLTPTNADFTDQKTWAEALDVRLMDAEYHKARKLAVRRVMFAAIDRAFEEIPDIETVSFSFTYDKKSLKDSIKAYGANQDPAQDKKINDKFNKLMGGARSRVGFDVSTWEALGAFFGGAERKLVRGSHSYFIEKIFSEETSQWNEPTEMQWQAQWLDINTNAAIGRKSGPRL